MNLESESSFKQIFTSLEILFSWLVTLVDKILANFRYISMGWLDTLVYIVGLIYLVSPIDLIPDVIPVVSVSACKICL